MAAKRKAGRCTKLTPEVQEKILNAIRAGNFPAPAARWAGSSYSALRRFVKAGEARPKSEAGQFRKRYMEAINASEIENVSWLGNAAKAGDVSAIKFMLSNR